MHQNDQTYLNNRTSILKATANKIQNHQNDQKSPKIEAKHANPPRIKIHDS